nr:unnamed protein product [Naegleria fowleri]
MMNSSQTLQLSSSPPLPPSASTKPPLSSRSTWTTQIISSHNHHHVVESLSQQHSEQPPLNELTRRTIQTTTTPPPPIKPSTSSIPISSHSPSSTLTTSSCEMLVVTTTTTTVNGRPSHDYCTPHSKCTNNHHDVTLSRRSCHKDDNHDHHHCEEELTTFECHKEKDFFENDWNHPVLTTTATTNAISEFQTSATSHSSTCSCPRSGPPGVSADTNGTNGTDSPLPSSTTATTATTTTPDTMHDTPNNQTQVEETSPHPLHWSHALIDSPTCTTPPSSHHHHHFTTTTITTTTTTGSSSSDSLGGGGAQSVAILNSSDPTLVYANYMKGTDSKSLLLQYCVLGMEQEFKDLLGREIENLSCSLSSSSSSSSLSSLQTVNHHHYSISTDINTTTTTTTSDTTTTTTNPHVDDQEQPQQEQPQEPMDTTRTTTTHETLHYESSPSSPSQLILAQSKLLTSTFIYSDHDKCSLFHLASKFNQVHLLEFMYDMVPSLIFMKDSKQAHPLFYAVSNNAKESVAFLCNAASVTMNGNNQLLPVSKFVNELDMYGGCCLYLALQKSFFELADLLLLFGANIDISFKTGETMLHRAITERRLDIVEYLCKKGANLLKQNQNNENPLFNVFVHQKKKLSDLNEKTVNGFFTTNNANFCKNGAQFLQNLLKSDCFSSEVIMKGLKQKNSHGRTMFQECIVKGDLPSFKVLLAYLTTRQSSETLSWFVNDVENQKNRTALHLSVVYKQFHMFKMLVESIPGIAKLDATDSDGKTALDIAKDTNQDNVVELFNEMAELQKPKKKKGFGLKSLFSRNKSKNK